MKEGRGGCGAHSFCATCYDADGDLNSNCDAILQHYADFVASSNGAKSTTNVAMFFWAELEYWCETLGDKQSL